MFPGVWQNRRVGGISDKEQCEHDTQRHARPDCHAVVILVKDRLDGTYEQHPAEAEADRACQADMSVHIADMSAVVPPADAPFPLQPYSGEVLQHSAQDAGKNENGGRVFSESVKQYDQYHTACAVDRKIGAPIYTSVYKSVGSNKIEQHFPEPPGESCAEKQ